MKKTVVLVPGVGMGGAEMYFLAGQLCRAGYTTHVFWFSPWTTDLGGAAEKLWRLVASLGEGASPQFVGHSLACLHESHSTMLVSRRAARAVVRFLSTGTFGGTVRGNGMDSGSRAVEAGGR